LFPFHWCSWYQE